MTDKPIYRAIFDPDESPNLPYQAQYYSGTTYHKDGYERGGWYATEAEAIQGAIRGKMTADALNSLIKDKQKQHEIVHTEELDKHNRLIIRDVPENAPKRYIWRIDFINEAGETYGSCSEGEWFETTAAAIAAGYTYYLMEEKEDGN